jgi:methylmalonyl-CoA mutase cobalamin-binding subunit
VVEEPGEHARRLEEVERVAARRRVDHHEVEPFVVVELVERLGRHVLLGAAQRPGDVAVEAVLEDPLSLIVVAGVGAHHLIEHRGRVEHHRPQLSALGLDGQFDLLRLCGRDRRAGRAHRRGGEPGRS